MTRSRYAVHQQKIRKYPKKCPNCKSQRIEQMKRKIAEDGEIIELVGWYCINCGMQNARRYV